MHSLNGWAYNGKVSAFNPLYVRGILEWVLFYMRMVEGCSAGIIIPEQRTYGRVNMSMDEDEVKGKGKQIKGRIREEVGKLTDNKTEQIKGKIEQVEGKVQEEIGKIKRKAKK